MWKFAVLSLALLVTSRGVFSECIPGDNCKLPDCRCWDDPKVPGGLAVKDVPQMVIVSFAYGINVANAGAYQALFDGIKNPNQCPPKATFFPSQVNTDLSVVKSLYDNKHEIAMTTPTGKIPQTAEQWKEAFATMKAKLVEAGIPEAGITGSRGAELFSGGDDQFDSITENKLEYDSTCVSLEYMEKNNLIWPYTHDYIENTPACSIGKTPAKAHPGKWQFLVADLEFGGLKCAVPSACTSKIADSQDAFDFFFNTFSKHYDGTTRAPFILYIDPLWLTVESHVQGTKQFLEFLRAGYEDTWIVTTQQALAWIQNPVPSAEAADFEPWKC